MIESRFGELEVLVRSPRGPERKTPLLFVHGAYTAAWCWEEYFLPFFAEAGYCAYAVSLSGHGASEGRAYLDALSLADFTRDVLKVAALLESPPVLIGHSMGGMVVQKCLEEVSVPAAVLMASVPPQGLWASAVGLALRKPDLMGQLNALFTGGQISMEALRDALFAQPISTERLRALARYVQPESARAIWDMTLFDLPRPGRMKSVPMMVMGAECDHLIPPALVDMTAQTYGVEAHIFSQMGHGMMLEADWRSVAQALLEWLDGALLHETWSAA